MHLNWADNYFDLFGIQVGFSVELAQIESKYRELQSLLHPDRYVTSGAQEKRLAVQGAALVNQAYSVLTDDCARANYLLDLKGMKPQDGSATVKDSEFLIEQMELREALEQSEDGDDLVQELVTLEEQTRKRLAELSMHFEHMYAVGDFDGAQEIVLKMTFMKKLCDEIKSKSRGSSVSGK